MPFKTFEDFHNSNEIVFALKNNPNIKIVITLSPDRRIADINNPNHLRFPYQIGQPVHRNIETWACNNNFTMNGKSTCPEEKVFGIRKSDIPKGHPLRLMYPSKFRE